MINKIGEIRPGQLITTFGPGSIMDAKNDSITILDTNYWNRMDCIKISEPRLASFLKVYNFYMPKANIETLPVISFPNYHVCSYCNHLFKVSKDFDLQTYIKKGPKCPKCGKFLAHPARLIIACENNHLDDFPWRWWAHGKTHTDCCGDLYLKSSGHTSSLGDLIVSCSCGASLSLSGATEKDALTEFACTGYNPHIPDGNNNRCDKTPKTILRGSTSAYFSTIRSALSIPPWNNPADTLISDNYDNIKPCLQFANLRQVYDTNFSDCGIKYDDFKDAFERREKDIHSYKTIKEMEYEAFIHPNDYNNQGEIKKYFNLEEVNFTSPFNNYFARIIKVHRLREVMALIGFSRLSSPDPEAKDSPQIKYLGTKGQWYPAVEINGEGIFIELNKDKLETWINDPSINSLSNKYENAFNKWVKEKQWNIIEPRNAVYVLLHTFAHMLINELSLVCGYSSSALKERIYYSKDLKMCGLLIYTGASDKEGTLGGLVDMGNISKLQPLVFRALNKAKFCSNDPSCCNSKITYKDMNGSACHACAMISETSCEMGNRLLDRSLILSLPQNKEDTVGFFDGLIK